MNDVIYVPNLRNNLLSVMKLMDRGLEVNFSKDTAEICRKNNSKIVAVGEQLGDHLIIYMTPLREVRINECQNTYINSKLDTLNEETNKFSENIEDKWHRRLGHVNNKYIQRLIKENLVTGIKDRELKEINCESCKTCKLSRKTHKSIDYEQSNEISELLHIDVCGSMSVESIGGSRYILLIVDDYSSMYFTYFLKNKSDVLHMLITFKEKCNNVLGKRIKCIHR